MLPSRPGGEPIPGESGPPGFGAHQKVEMGGGELPAVPGRFRQKEEQVIQVEDVRARQTAERVLKPQEHLLAVFYKDHEPILRQKLAMGAPPCRDRHTSNPCRGFTAPQPPLRPPLKGAKKSLSSLSATGF